MEDIDLNYHLTKFGDNCKTQCGNMGKTIENLLTGGHKLASSLRMDIDREIIVERNYQRTIFTTSIHLINEICAAFKSLCIQYRPLGIVEVCRGLCIPIKLNLYCYCIMYYHIII